MFRLSRIRARPPPLSAAPRPVVPSRRPFELPRAVPPVRHESSTVAHIQRVRFRRPPLFSLRHNVRRLAGVALVAGTVLIYLEAFARHLDSLDLDDLEEEYEDEEEDEDEDEEDSWFIPLGWAKPKPREFYRASDPEWQGFLKVAKDPKEREHIQMGLVGIVRGDVSRSPVAERELGRIDIRKGRWWLDLFFPDGPPPEYERLAIEVAKDYVALTYQTVEQRDYQRLLQTLMPTAILTSFLATSKYIFTSNLEKLKKTIGVSAVEERKTTAPNARVKEIAQQHEQTGMNKATELLAKSFRDQNPQNPTDPKQPTDTSQPPQNAPAFQMPRPHHPAGGTDQAPSETEKDFKKLDQQKQLPSQNEGQALAVFQNTLKRNWRGLKLTVPRGCVFVAGRVEVLGSKGRAIVDVGGAYDPELRQYVAVSGHVRAIQQHSQSPKGGP